MKTNLFLLAQIGFGALTIFYLLLLVRMLREGIEQTSWSSRSKANVYRKITGTLLAWLALIGVWSASDMMGRFDLFPLNFAPVIVIPLIVILTLTIFSKGLTEILGNIPHYKIIQLQNFRLFVELLLWTLFIAGALPKQMTFEGLNFDVLSGVSAVLVSWFASRGKLSRPIAILWNFLGLGLLINIVTIAILSTPTPWQVFFEEPANTVVTVFPISFLPGFLVPLAYTLHLFSLKQLLAQRSSRASFA